MLKKNSLYENKRFRYMLLYLIVVNINTYSNNTNNFSTKSQTPKMVQNTGKSLTEVEDI